LWIGSNLELAQSGKMQPEDTDNVAATVIQMCGCLFHPQAREYLNARVITEISDRMKECNDKGGSNAAYLAYAYAIDIVQNGVKNYE
jgi:hypothetical protein